jgi:hypothetical protein
MAKSANYPLRLSQSVMRVAKETAEREGVSLNQFIAGAVGEKLAALRTEDLLKERAGRADWQRVQTILDRVGTEPPRAGDELPQDP